MTNDYTICIEAFVRWEQLTGRSFQQMNFEDASDLHRLLYCAYLIDKPFKTVFETFEKTLLANKRLYKGAISSLSHYNTVAAQFAAITPQPTLSDEATPDTPVLLGDVVARLIISGGLDAHYVMREMTIEDMLRYVKALDDKQRQESEAARLWTYLSILPHVDSKKLTSPKKLLLFPWEVVEAEAEAKRIAEEGREDFDKFMRGEYPFSNSTK